MSFTEQKHDVTMSRRMVYGMLFLVLKICVLFLLHTKTLTRAKQAQACNTRAMRTTTYCFNLCISLLYGLFRVRYN